MKIKHTSLCSDLTQKTWNLIQDAILSNLIPFQKKKKEKNFFKNREKKCFMHEHTWHDEPISVKLFFLVLLPKEGSGKMQVCVYEDQ